MRSKLFVAVGAISIALLSSVAHAAPDWYSGKITRIWPYSADGDFVITFDTEALADCQHRYVYFNKSASMGDVLLRNSLSIASAAFYANAKVGVVIDKTGPGAVCRALSIDVSK